MSTQSPFLRLSLAGLLLTLTFHAAADDNARWQRVWGAWVDGRFVSGAYGGGTDDSRPVLADLDGDGDLDVFMGDWWGWLTFYENVGSARQPVWAPPLTQYADIDVGHYSSPALVDLDADGDLDLVLGEQNGTLYLFENVGSATAATWAAPVANYAAIDAGDWSAPVLGDLDGDGDFDLLVGKSNGTLLFVENTGTSATAAWAAPVEDYAGVDVGGFALPTLADLDGDGDLDLMVGTYWGTLTYYENVGTAARAVWASPQVGYNGIDLGVNAFPAFGDLDADGDLDLLIGESQGALTYYENIGNSTTPAWAPAIPNYDAIDVGYMTMPALGDLDADGDLDLLLGEWESGVTFFENIGKTGTGNSFRRALFRSAQLISRNEYPVPVFHWSAPVRGWVGAEAVPGAAPALGDLDADDDLDLVLGVSSGTLIYRQNVGTPQSAAWAAPVFDFAAVQVALGARPALVDLDADGDLDLFVGEADGTLVFVENFGGPASMSWATPMAGWNGIDVGHHAAPAFGDLDRDGDLDLLVGNFDGRLTYFENIGTPQSPDWAAPVEHFLGIDVWEAAAPCLAGLDADGDLDLVIGERDGGLNVYCRRSPESAARRDWSMYP